jgi:hypothetical protein
MVLARMDTLPGEMVLELLGWVRASDVASVRLVCRQWRDLFDAHDARLWRRTYFRAWPPPLACPSSTTGSATSDPEPGHRVVPEVDWKRVAVHRLSLLQRCKPPPHTGRETVAD